MIRVTKHLAYWEKYARILNLLRPYMRDDENIYIVKYGPTNFVTGGQQNRCVSISQKHHWIFHRHLLSIGLLSPLGKWMSVYTNNTRGLELANKLAELLPKMEITVHPGGTQ